MSRPTVLSLFSGIGGFDLGLERAGFEVVGQVEIDPFCNKVLGRHWPEVPRYGDVRNIGVGPQECNQQGESDDGKARLSDIARAGYVDLICGGFPCQDLSVAGKRAGLAGDRSGLWFEFHRVLSELRPAYCLVENVPGLLSSNEGRDFAVILNGLGELGYVVGWATLDSQFFGVPQRRRRVYIVGGPTRERVAQILSLCEGGDWHPQKGRETGEDVAGTIGGGAYGAGERPEYGVPNYAVANTLQAPKDGTHVPADANDANLIIAHSLSSEGFDASEDGTGRGTPLVSYAVRMGQQGANGHGVATETTHALDSAATSQAIVGAAVRRLTPVECERLQGFPDDWTKLDENTPDGPRYRALGNAVSVPVVEYLGLRMREVM